MAAILQKTFSNSFIEWKIVVLILISLKFVPKDLISNNLAIVQIMAWRQTGDKSLFEQMMAYL